MENNINNTNNTNMEKCKKLKQELFKCMSDKLVSDFNSSFNCEDKYDQYKRECDDERIKKLRCSIFATY